MILGFTWPRMVLFGAECPTTIFLIGFLLSTFPRTNKILLIVVSLNAIITGTSVAINGAAFDYLYALAGVLGIIMMTKYFHVLFFSNHNEEGK